ncbi:MAG: hypothetical protein GOVbin1096_13 [Prokaryotic dsDNA virus sp.]|jgi:hypothetical protein|nr:MAG: hypothetical protein GOVbin1096_13 [Prokaryotic dsDNA virus sp.]|tara:strand:- start:44292 stop:44510 length:219 start_codon:yes stop_codon:yes gene_type:complete
MKKLTVEVYEIHEKLPEYECENVLVFTSHFLKGVDAFYQDGKFWLDDELDTFFKEDTIIGWCYYPKKEQIIK